MNILIISNSFYPQNSPRAFRTTELVKEFSRQNHEVTLYLPESDFDHSGFINQYPNVVIKKSISLGDGKPIFLNGRLQYFWNLMLTFFFHYPHIKYYFQLPKILAKENNFDLLISIAYPHPIHWGVSKAFKQRKGIAKTWVADCGDPYMLGGSKKMFYFKYLEKSFCRIADYISIPVEKAKDGYYNEFRDKLRIIPQAYNFNNIMISKYVPNPIPTFAYAGRFVQNDYDPRPILDFLINNKSDFCFNIYTNQKELFKDYSFLVNKKVFLFDFIDRDSLIYELSKVDFLLYLESNDPVRVPHKIIDYTLTNRPILTLNSKKINKSLFIEFLNRDYTNQTKIDISESDIKVACKKFIELHDSIQ